MQHSDLFFNIQAHLDLVRVNLRLRRAAKRDGQGGLGSSRHRPRRLVDVRLAPQNRTPAPQVRCRAWKIWCDKSWCDCWSSPADVINDQASIFNHRLRGVHRGVGVPGSRAGLASRRISRHAGTTGGLHAGRIKGLRPENSRRDPYHALPSLQHQETVPPTARRSLLKSGADLRAPTR
jgi:hypothetical protein